MTEGKVMSFGQDDLVEGGGLDDLWVRFSDCKFVQWQGPNDTFRDPGIFFQFTPISVETEEPLKDEHHGIGKLERWGASDDGAKLIALSEDTRGVNKKSGFGKFMQRAFDGGLPPEVVTSDIGFLNGMEAHFVREEKTTKEGKVNWDYFPDQFRIKTKKAKGKGKGKAKPEKAAGNDADAPSASSNGLTPDDAKDQLTEFLTGVILEHEDGIPKNRRVAVVNKAHKDELISQVQQRSFVRIMALQPDVLAECVEAAGGKIEDSVILAV